MMYMIKSKSNIEKVREKVRKLKNEIKRLEIEKSITKFPMSDEIPIFQIIDSKDDNSPRFVLHAIAK